MDVDISSISDRVIRYSDSRDMHVCSDIGTYLQTGQCQLSPQVLDGIHQTDRIQLVGMRFLFFFSLYQTFVILPWTSHRQRSAVNLDYPSPTLTYRSRGGNRRKHTHAVGFPKTTYAVYANRRKRTESLRAASPSPIQQV